MIDIVYIINIFFNCFFFIVGDSWNRLESEVFKELEAKVLLKGVFVCLFFLV